MSSRSSMSLASPFEQMYGTAALQPCNLDVTSSSVDVASVAAMDQSASSVKRPRSHTPSSVESNDATNVISDVTKRINDATANRQVDDVTNGESLVQMRRVALPPQPVALQPQAVAMQPTPAACMWQAQYDYGSFQHLAYHQQANGGQMDVSNVR